MESMNEEKDKKPYELAILLKNEDEFGRVAEILRQHSGELVGEPRLKKIALAYTIKGHAEAVFVSCLFHALATDAKALEEDLTTRADTIRFMILNAKPQAEGRPTMVPSFGEDSRRKMGPGTYQSAPHREPKPAAPAPLSNEALEDLLKKI